MAKHFYWLAFVLWAGTCHGQITVRVYTKRLCNGNGITNLVYGIKSMSNDSVFYPGETDTAVITLPKPGIYKLYIPYVRDEEPMVFTIPDSATHYTLTYIQPQIQLLFTGFHSPDAYYGCDTLLQGYAEDHYPSGQVRLRGNFRNGLYQDSLTTFYANGNVWKRYVRKGYSEHEQVFFNSAQNLSLNYVVIRDAHKRIVKSHYTTFFENGKVEFDEVQVGGVEKSVSYFENGNLKFKQGKTGRREYFEQGGLKVSYTWHFQKSSDSLKKTFDAIVLRKEYDINGQLTQFSKYIHRKYYKKLQPQLSLEEADRIVSIAKYSNGKEVFKIENIDPKEYFRLKPVDVRTQ